jgi:NADH-quinone oxidoreductase subunit L
VPRLARALEARGERPLVAAVTRLGVGIRRLGDLGRRPQTGQQHQYYAQGVVAVGTLAALVAVLVVTGVR